MAWYVKHSVEPFLECVRPGNIIETEIYSECCKLPQGVYKGRYDNVLLAVKSIGNCVRNTTWNMQTNGMNTNHKGC